MYIIEVIPLTLLPPNVPQILSYFFDPVRGKTPLEEGSSADRVPQERAMPHSENHASQAGRTSNGAGSALPKGAIVEVEINKRKVRAVVISSSSLEKEKLALKKVDFRIKKINKVLFKEPQISDYQLKLAVWLARYYYAPLGYTLKTILPPFAFKKKYLPIQFESRFYRGSSTKSGQSSSTESRILDSSAKPDGLGRIGTVQPSKQLLIYKTKGLVKHLEPLIKQTAPRQILIMVSEKTSINYFSDHFLEKYNTVVVHSGLSNEKLYDVWSRLTSHESVTSQSRILDSQSESGRKAESGEAKLIIGTRQALNMPFKDLGLIIVDDPLHEFYKSDMVPRYNAVKLAYKVAELNNARLVLTSVIPGIENYYRYKLSIPKPPSGGRDPGPQGLGTTNPAGSLSADRHSERGRTSNGAGNRRQVRIKNIETRPKFDAEIIDMAQEVKNANWSPISKKLNEEILAHLRKNKRVLVFSPRRGYAGILICGNCGSAVKCPRCEVAMRTHRAVEMILVCHHCGVSKLMPRNCSICGNHNLKTMGPAGTQKIYDLVKTRLANENIKCPVLAMDTDIVKNETEEEEIISEINKSKASVLIATQMVFSHRFYLNFDLIAIVNADALTNIPDFRSEENLFYQVEKLVNFSPDKLIIQTYNPENKLIEKAANGEYKEFYEKELKLREALNYPPFSKLIKLTFRHTNRDKASYAARITTEKLKMAIARAKLGEEIKIIEAAPAYIEREKGLYFYNIFLKVKEGYQDTNDLLKYAGPGWLIDVEPRSLL